MTGVSDGSLRNRASVNGLSERCNASDGSTKNASLRLGGGSKTSLQGRWAGTTHSTFVHGYAGHTTDDVLTHAYL